MVRIQYDTFRTASIAEPESVFNQNIAVVRLPVLQELAGPRAIVSLVQVRLKRLFDASAADATKVRLQAVSGGLAISDGAEFTGNLQFIKTVWAIALAVSVVMMVASSIMVANTLPMAVSERL